MKDIKELFEESRRADRAATPSFRSMTSGGRKAPKPVRWRIAALAVATATAVGALALALYILPRLEQETPLQVRLEAAPADPEPEVVPPEPDVAVKSKKYVPLPPPPAPIPSSPPVTAEKAMPGPSYEVIDSPMAGGVTVVVTNSEGLPLPGSTVTVSHDTGYVKTTAALSDRNGRVGFPILRPGDGYHLEVAFPGFNTIRQGPVKVRPNEITHFPVQMMEEFQERVKVVAGTALIDLDQTQQSTRFSENFISDRPVPGLFYQNVLTMVPGVHDADGDGHPNIHGSRPRDFQAAVSGVSGVDPLTSQSMSPAEESFSTETYDPIHENGFVAVADEPLSTFSIDVDTASYSNVRRFLQNGELPPADAVRIEELINYFSYDDPAPTGDEPFSVNVEIAGCPWNAEHRLARIGLKGRENDRSVGSNLVFLIDVSGSMQPANKLPLLKLALRLLVDQLDGRDQVAIVVYAGATGLVLPPTSGDGKQEILEALGKLQAGGSTNGGAGLSLAYKLAGENYIPGGVNRVILATDGDFNVGMTNRGSLVRRIRKDAERGIFLTTLGFGMGNLKDATLETLADKGNGNYAYIDSLAEARKVLVEEIGGTLVTIAKDVKLQVEFNPLQVGAYRLIGYENRMLNKEDFNDDRKDAGEIGAGHSVIALYEIVPPGMPESRAAVDPLRYQQPQLPDESAENGEMFTLKLRYKEPEGKSSLLVSFPVVDEGLDTAQASPDFKFASAVAAFGMLLRDSSYAGDVGFESIRSLGLAGRDHDEAGYRAGFIDLVNRAEELQAAP